MTEEDAKTKWCPFSRTLVTLDRADNRTPIAVGSANRFTDHVSLCIADACMAWRPIDVQHAFDIESGVDLGVKLAIHMPTQEYRRVPAGGYCGLAGQPA